MLRFLPESGGMYFRNNIFELGGIHMDRILIEKPISIIAQTSQEKVLGKIEEDHLLKLKKIAEEHLWELKRAFAQKFFYASRIILKHSHRWSELKNFCNRFPAEERIALEESMRRHPSFKARVATFFLFCSGVASITAWAFLFCQHTMEFGLILWLDTVFFGLCFAGVFKFPVVDYFFTRRKLIRLGGLKAVEDVIKTM